MQKQVYLTLYIIFHKGKKMDAWIYIMSHIKSQKRMLNDFSTPRGDTVNMLTHTRPQKNLSKITVVVWNHKVGCPFHMDAKYLVFAILK